MTSHSYEVALFGEFFPKDLPGTLDFIIASSLLSSSGDTHKIPHVAIMNRITLHSESAQPSHVREILFEPFDAQYQRDTGSEPVPLRARKELLEPKPKWYGILTLMCANGSCRFTYPPASGPFTRTSNLNPCAYTLRRRYGHGQYVKLRATR